MVCRDEFANREWSFLSPLLLNKPPGTPGIDDRLTLNDIFWCFGAGSPWMEAAVPMAALHGTRE